MTQVTGRMPNRVTGRQLAHVFAVVTRAGAASRRPYGRNSASAEDGGLMAVLCHLQESLMDRGVFGQFGMKRGG
jgi:hypothetical protein